MKLTHIAATAAVIGACAAAAAAATNQVPLDQQQEINQAVDTLLPFLPAPLVTVLAGLSVLLVPLMAIGRLMLGYRQAGLQGAVSGLLTGSNVPKVVQDCPLMTPPKAKSRPLACIAIAATIAALGCAHVSSHQTTSQSAWTTTNGIPVVTTTQQTTASAWTCFDANDSISNFAAAQSLTNQSCGVTGLNVSSTSTNLNAIIAAVVSAAVSAAK
jgi:hypothetical protein